MFTRGLSFAWLRGFDTCSRHKGMKSLGGGNEKKMVISVDQK